MDIYAQERLRINLRPFQAIMIHLMGISQVFFAICARASAKTFTVALFAVCKCMLYPDTEVVITASTNLSDEDIEKAVKDAEAHAAED